MLSTLAEQDPESFIVLGITAHALLVDMGNGGHRVSVRAPYSRKSGADELCRQFESGRGSKAAAGINCLAHGLHQDFVYQFDNFFRSSE